MTDKENVKTAKNLHDTLVTHVKESDRAIKRIGGV